MVKNCFAILRCVGKVMSIILVIGACNARLSEIEPLPEKFIPPKNVRPKIVESTWRFETISSPRRFQFAGQDWMAIDSTGQPAIAYGGNRLNYAWFDGTNWQVEMIDPRPGTGKFARLLFDANDQPHIMYGTDGVIELSLETIYRDSERWHRQTIDPNFCFGRNLDMILDYQGDPVVAYEVSPSCKSSDYYATQIRVAHQVENTWQITVLSENGLKPSLVIDREADLHLGYLDTRRDLRNWAEKKLS
jgi:hypothetical protein